MKRSTYRILTTHAGSLSRPGDLIAMYRDQEPPENLQAKLTSAVADAVAKQAAAGIDVVNDGEYGKPVTDGVDYGARSTYIHERLSGFEMRQPPPDFNVIDTVMVGSKDRIDFAEFYRSGEAGFSRPGRRMLRSMSDR